MRAAVITFAGAGALAAFARELGDLGMPLLGDPDRSLYAAFGFGRGSVARIWLDPRAIGNDLRLRMRGRAAPARLPGQDTRLPRQDTRLPRQDTLQLGGDVVLDAAGRVRWVYASRGPEDRPTVEAIIGAVLRCP